MRLLHERHVLHCDVHPGNIGVTPRVPLALLLSPSSPFDFNDLAHWQVVFIDHEWSHVRGWHYEDTFVRNRMWLYASDRQVWCSGKYSTPDDLEALAYILLAIYYSGRLPWRSDVEAESAKYPQDFGEDDSDLEFVFETRERHLRTLRDSCHESDSASDVDSLLADLLDFVFYARALNSDEVWIDYSRWESLFHERFTRTSQSPAQ
uniref:Protein-serine/threonine kinase (EC) n=1 Tax=Ganoderma boninense TaxID=34458 RepID=A0A5K1K6C2_9APHY|nr:Protein-serine/threonine kinase (EC [Ganoderma boninense]